MEWDKRAWALVGDEPDTYIVRLQMRATSDVKPWQWEDYAVSQLVYNYIIEADGRVILVGKRVDAVGDEGDRINWYGDYAKGDSAIFDEMAVDAIGEYRSKPKAITYRDSLIVELLKGQVQSVNDNAKRTNEYYAERRQELVKEEKEDMSDLCDELARAQAELRRFQTKAVTEVM